MTIASLVSLSFVVMSITSFLVYLPRSIKSLRQYSRSAIMKITISTIFSIFVSISANKTPFDFRYHILGILSTHQSLLFVYFGIMEIFHNTRYNILKTKFYRASASISIFIILLDVIRRNNMGRFLYNEPYNPTFVYYLSYILNHGLSLLIILYILQIYRLDIIRKPQPEITYAIRRAIGFIGFIFGAICMILVEVNVFLAIFYDDSIRYTLNGFYPLTKLLFTTLIVSSVAIPQFILNGLAKLALAYKYVKLIDQTTSIAHLHKIITTIVPSLILPSQTLQKYRLIIEIGDARELIWSSISLSPANNPEIEAYRLFELIKQGKIISETGSYIPPKIEPKYEAAYYHKIGKHLLNLERIANGKPYPSAQS